MFDAAFSRAKRRESGSPRELVKEPTAYLFGYRDGLEATAFVMNGVMRDFTVAVLPEVSSEPLSALMWLEYGQPVRYFACLAQKLEPFFETGRPTNPVERTLLVSGMLDFGLESRIQGYRRLETPGLRVRYEAPREAQFCEALRPGFDCSPLSSVPRGTGHKANPIAVLRNMIPTDNRRIIRAS